MGLNEAYIAAGRLNIPTESILAFLLATTFSFFLDMVDIVTNILQEVGEVHIVPQFEEAFIIKRGLETTIRFRVSPEGETTIEILDNQSPSFP